MNKEKFQAYESVRKSGATNMFNVELVGSLTELTKSEIFDIMKNYGKYKKEFML